MSNTRELIDAIQAGDSTAIEQTFQTAMADRIAERLDTMRQEVARSMFKAESMVEEEVESIEEADQKKEPHPDALHVQPVEGGKYKVHAVGKNFANGIKPGEHLSDTDLDDFQEMGGKVKHVK